MMVSRRAQLAFTLIEVLVALAIFAILALISYRTLSSIFETRERLQKSSQVLRDQALFFARLENDLSAILPRAIRNGDGQMEAALVIATPQNTNDAIIRMTRAGFAANVGSYAAPQRIGYRLKDNTLELIIWDGIDLAPRSEPKAYDALKNIREFRWRVLAKPNPNDREAIWLNEWTPNAASPQANQTQLPLALEVTLSPVEGAPVVRLFSLRDVRGAT
jgi:general secretion pathway protein J